MKKSIAVIFLVVSTGFTFCQEVSDAYEVRLQILYSFSVDTILPDRAAQMDDAIFLDAREKKEFSVSHIKDARWVGYDEPDYSVLNNIPKDTKLILYCSVGYRSEKIGEKLLDMGYENVYNLYGGIFHWVNSDYAVYLGGKETNNVHAYNEAWGKWLEKGNKVYE